MTGETGRHRIEPFWDAQLAMGVVIVLFALLPDELRLGPRWLGPGLAAAVLLAVSTATPWRPTSPPEHFAPRRLLVLALLGLLTTASVVALANLVGLLVNRGSLNGTSLLTAAATVWLANVAIFAVAYWELDRGGPITRSRGAEVEATPPDLLFVQMTDTRWAPPGWMPAFADYLYVSFTTATAFSPTDTMPLTVRVKALMLVQALVSFVTVALVAARAVNILG